MVGQSGDFFGSRGTARGEVQRRGLAAVGGDDAPLQDLIRTRLVQSNVVRRAIALRYARWAIGRRCAGPVHLVEVGASAGLLMNADKYRYVIGDRHFGPPDAPVALDSQWRGSRTASVPAADSARVPDLDAAPRIASKIVVDL